MKSKYIPSKIEPKWQKVWEENKFYATPDISEDGNKKYILDMFPYPSGAGLHVGHPLGYIATDIYCRYLRLKDCDVLHPMGWDAFGLPAENYAIKTSVHPAQSTQKNIQTFKHQIKRLGLSYDWDREINTSSPDYYRWTQWLFIQLYNAGFAYQKKAPVNWCESCKTVLANEQVVTGKCERCQGTVIQKELKQWFFKITNYADKLLEDMDELDWPEQIKTMQRNWIGKSEGATIKFKVKSLKLKVDDIDVFTTRPDTLCGATYLVLSPEHQSISNLKPQILNWNEVEDYIKQTKLKTDLQKTDLNKEKSGVELKGVKAINPVNNKEIPIWIADYVLSSYGTGAIMAVPAHDKRDFEFAKKYNLGIIRVIKGGRLPYIGDGKMINSDEFSGLLSNDAKQKITYKAGGKATISYKLRDWLVSRQRYWGAPIPIIYCEKCGTMPVPEDQLPVVLPTDIDFKPTGESPLVESKSFHSVLCPKCHSPARRESDTMDTFVDSSWYYLAYIMRGISNLQFPISKYKEGFNQWMPIDTYVGGAEHAVLHLLYARFVTKALRDMEHLEFGEPFKQLRNQGLILAEDGRKMSKSFGNVINPDDVVEQFGADTFRIYEMFMGPFEDVKPWSTRSIIGSYRFLEKVWSVGNEKGFATNDNAQLKNLLNKLIVKVESDIKSFSFNTAISSLMSFLNHVVKAGISIKQWRKYLVLLSPFAPHICEELWQISGEKESIFNEKWVSPEDDIMGNVYNIAVQINNKMRGTVIVDNIETKESDLIELIKADNGFDRYLVGDYRVIKYIPGEKIIIMVS